MNTRLTRALLVAVAIGGLLVASAAFADPLIPGKTRIGDESPAAPAAKTQAQAKAAPAGNRVSVLVHVQAGADRGPIRGFAAAQGGQVKYEYDILPNVMNLRGIPQGALNALAATRGVVRWEPDGEVHAHMNDSTPLIRALQSQINGACLSADGSGIRVCIIDTGIDSDSAMYASRIDTAAGRDFVNNDNDPEDDAGHGAHVAGTAVGGDTLTVNFGCVGSEPFHGIAPQATLIGIKVLGANGSGSFSDVIAGINYGADQTASGGRCDVINMSLGGGAFSGSCDGDSAAAAANNAVDAGVVVVSSSGNEANNNAMGTPACGSKVIAVGATYDDDYPNCEFPNLTSFTFCIQSFIFCTQTCTDNAPSVDQITCMSNRSTELDVTAPGCVTFSADKDASPNGIVGFCGTSMASPHVAGLAALLLSADGSLTPAEVRQHIRDGAVDLGAAGFDTVYGHGRIDAINSLSLVGPQCSVAADCDDGNACNVDICNAGTCEHTLEPAGTVCRPSAGSCDAQETCDGVIAACPADTLVAAGTVCRASAGVCDPQETCDGVTAACPADALVTAGTVCRASAGPCDVQETCDGVTAACPADALVTPGTVCRASASACDVEETCDGVTATCPADAFQAAGTSCDDSMFCNGAETCDGFGVCDAGTDPCPGQSCNETTDTCDECVVNLDCEDGNACNVDVCNAGICEYTLEPAGAVCRASAGPCDPAEVCDGIVAICPADTLNPVGTECRASTGACDPQETCDGVTAACPADALVTAGTVCRASAGPCDVQETCDGVTATCPADAFEAAGTSCDDAMFCNGAETCDGFGVCDPGTDPCPGQSCNETTDACDECVVNVDCDDGNACNVDVCNGGVCEYTLEPVGTVCRASTGICDPQETCDGLTDGCPVDVLEPAGVECRTSAGACDPQESCDGVSAACPADTIDPAGTECRASTGSCDPAEVCSGASAACPSDTLEPAGTVCRASAGVCDVQESCDGVTAACPADGLVAAGTVCRASASACDVEETCDGVTATCPVDAFQPAGTSCDDSIFCNGAETCDGFGVCDPGTDPCTGGDVCNEATDTCDTPVCNDDGTCDSGEDQCNCAADCGTPPATETNCTDGIDEDCNQGTDCDDPDCSGDPACDCNLGQKKDPCVDDADCCSNKCKGRSGAKTCK